MEVVDEPLVVRSSGGLPGWPPPQAQLPRPLPRSSLSVCPHAHPHLAPGAADVAGGPPAAPLADKYPAGRPCVWPEEPEPLSPSSLP